MNWAVVKMLLAGLLVALVINLVIPPTEDARISRPTIAFMGLAGSFAGHYAARRVFGVTHGVWGLSAAAAGALVLIVAYLLLTPAEK